MIDLLAKLYRAIITVGLFIAPLALLILRLAYGYELVRSGLSHFQDVDTMVHRFTSWGIPFPRANVYISSGTELVGGALLMAGLGARAISIPLFFNFCVAYLTASRGKVVNFFQNDPATFIDDSAFPFLITSLVILSFGPGLFSLDALLMKTAFKRQALKT